MAPRLAQAALAAVALLLAGCIAPGIAPTTVPAPPAALEPLTEPVFALGAFLFEKVPSFDGVPIHIDVQLPEGDGPWPTILVFTPYSFPGDERWGAAQQFSIPDPGARQGTVAYYVPRGYAVAVAHVRGTGESGGCLTVGGPEEGKDGVALVEWIAAQPWSSGKVGMMGTSWVGTTPIEAAVLNPPHLTTIVPISPVTEWYRYYFELGQSRVNGDPPPGSSVTDPVFDVYLAWTPGVRTGVSELPAEMQCTAEFTQEYYFQHDYDAYWHARDHSVGVPNITASVLYAQGWKDENVATSMIPGFWEPLKAEKRAFFAQHAHGVPASREYFWDYVHRWLDYWLQGKQNGALSLPAVNVEDNLGTWRTEATWPPADANATRFWLAPQALAAEAPADGEAAFRDDGTGAEEPRLEGVNHLRFVSSPLAAPLHIAGLPRLHLEGASDRADTMFAAHLYDRAPNGTEAFVTRGYLDARHREGLDQGKDLTPGQRASFAWDLHPRDHRVEAGHQLVLVVKSSDKYVLSDAPGAVNAVFFGADGSWLDLPTIPDEDRAYLDEAPVPG